MVRRGGHALTGAAGAVLAAAALAACGLLASPAASSPGSPDASQPAPTPGTSAPPQPAAASCPAAPARISCAMRVRVAAVERYLKHRPGMIGLVLRDRKTGAVWRNKYAGSQVYMASTSKLAMAVTLLQRNQAGTIHLSSGDRATMTHMLHVSSDTAADDLWFKFGASFYTSYFGHIGLAHAHRYVLADLPASERDYLVKTLRHVAPDQHFGVWGAGPANRPGNKDGWSVEKPGWIINSAGFAGPTARYTLAEMNSLEGQGGYHAGTDTVTQVAAILFRGHQIPAPTVSPTP